MFYVFPMYKKPWVHDRWNHRITESLTDALIWVDLGNLIRFLQVNPK
jgi:hypothetical protein